jgi:hypothetical protein
MNYLWEQAKIHNLMYGLLIILKFLLWITYAKRKLWYKFRLQILTKTSLIKNLSISSTYNKSTRISK